MYNHHHCYFLELFNDPKKKLCTHEILPPPFLLPLTLGNSILLSDFVKLTPPRTSCKCHHTILVVLSLAHFPEHEVFKVPSRILSYGTWPPHFVDPFICWWTPGVSSSALLRMMLREGWCTSTCLSACSPVLWRIDLAVDLLGEAALTPHVGVGDELSGGFSRLCKKEPCSHLKTVHLSP